MNDIYITLNIHEKYLKLNVGPLDLATRILEYSFIFQHAAMKIYDRIVILCVIQNLSGLISDFAHSRFLCVFMKSYFILHVAANRLYN